MNPENRRGPGNYRCGCGARIKVAARPITHRVCWYADCNVAPTTPEPLSLCAEHEHDVAARVAHIVANGAMHRWADARRTAGEEWYRPLDSYQKVPDPVPSWVYFMRRERLIKIGFTVDLRRRAETLNATVLAKTPGGLAEERQMHTRFAHLRRHGEWFEPDPELLEYVNGLRRGEHLSPLAA
jgi:hypothetical protein